jgi:hypothetical protein
MIIEHPLPGVVHLHFETQDALCRVFVRLQEFYESPYDEIRGHYFSHDKFIARYAETHGYPFSYYSDWHGFNLPAKAVYDFAKLFANDITAEEFDIVAAVKLHAGKYLIATHQELDIDHELAHALFYLDVDYLDKVDTLLDALDVNTDLALREWLIKEGYTKSVLRDEYNAFLSTNDRDEWITFHKFTPALADHMYEAGEPFRALFNFTLAE